MLFINFAREGPQEGMGPHKEFICDQLNSAAQNEGESVM